MGGWKCFHCEKELRENEKCFCKKSKERWGYITINTIRSGKEYVCPCGNNSFKLISHMDYKDSYSSTYECNKCGNHIGVCFQRVESWW